MVGLGVRDRGVSVSLVSETRNRVDERMKELWSRPLSEEYPFVWINAFYEKVCRDGRVVAVEIMIAYGVTSTGQGEVLAVEDIKARLAEKLKKIWLEPNKASAENLASLVIKEHEKKYREAVLCNLYAYIKA